MVQFLPAGPLAPGPAHDRIDQIFQEIEEGPHQTDGHIHEDVARAGIKVGLRGRGKGRLQQGQQAEIAQRRRNGRSLHSVPPACNRRRFLSISAMRPRP